MANNNNLFNAALSGAATGLASRVIQSTDSSVYESQAALIEDFATAFDAEIAPIVGGGSRGQSEVVSQLCAAFWRDRIIPPDATFDEAAARLAAVYTALASSILPDAGEGGASTIVFSSTGSSHDTFGPAVVYTVTEAGMYRITGSARLVTPGTSTGGRLLMTLAVPVTGYQDPAGISIVFEGAMDCEGGCTNFNSAGGYMAVGMEINFGGASTLDGDAIVDWAICVEKLF